MNFICSQRPALGKSKSKNPSIFLMFIWAVMAYKSRGNVSSLKSVLVNPTNHGLQIQWYVLVFYIKVGFYYNDLPVSRIKVKTIGHFSFLISLCPRQMLMRYCTS